jgi:hypothetical protein
VIEDMPRATFSDFPKNGQLTPDVRIAYFVSKKGDGNFLGGDGFDARKITDETWRNLHHHFVEITRNGPPLAVMNRPEEKRRRSSENYRLVEEPTSPLHREDTSPTC